jgi:bifunctional UDP-N-acetylglucosamine pyrophosphorylase/glucosamine-1-phosphate N-acetyltransferase
MKLEVVILAAGKGSRMSSSEPKVMHELGGRPLLEHVLLTAESLPCDKIHVVLGHGSEKVREYLSQRKTSICHNIVYQDRQLGTGHAVQQTLDQIDPSIQPDLFLVLYGDVPLITTETLLDLIDRNRESLSLVTLETDNPDGLGRIIRTDDGTIAAIVEDKDATDEQRLIGEINTGIMLAPTAKLREWVDALANDNSQAEYYLTDIVSHAFDQGFSVDSICIGDEFEVQGVNDKLQLCILERHFQMQEAQKILASGAKVMDPTRLDIRGELVHGANLTLDVNVILTGEVTIGNDVLIGPHSCISNTKIGSGVTILSGCVIEGAIIEDDVMIGPNARLRPGTILKNRSKIGNFVEVKNSVIGTGSKANHLAYIGDATIGDGCNIGAGTIFCNYDGVDKHHTTLGDKVFVGSNCVLIAPVSIGDDAFIAAGSSVSKPVPNQNLAVGRSAQRNIEGWEKPKKEK